MDKFSWVTYILAIAIWNAVFIGLIVGALNVTYLQLGHPLLSKLDILIMYVIGFIVLFVLNMKIINDENNL